MLKQPSSQQNAYGASEEARQISLLTPSISDETLEIHLATRESIPDE
jgi:hypothetical protein